MNGYMVESREKRLLVWGDIIHATKAQFSRPTITIDDDVDPAQAIKTRQRVLQRGCEQGSLGGGPHVRAFPSDDAKERSMNSRDTGARCAEILHTCQYANIATCRDNQPWNTPVTAVPDAELNLYWSSWAQAVHSRNILANPQVFITFYDSTRERGTNNMRCLYLRCEASEVSDLEEARKAHGLIYPDERIDLADFSGDGLKRFYRARPLAAWVNILSERELQPATVKMREEVPLESIRLAT